MTFAGGRIQGSVVVEAVVGNDGGVSGSRDFVPFDPKYGLDEEALDAVSQWTFTSGELKGERVPVLMRFVVTFRIR
jgi:TonB family protein